MKDKKYKFLIKPIAAILTTAFGFALGIVHSFAKFMGWAMQAIFDRVNDALNAIKDATYEVLKSTWGIFRRIMSNPLTIILLIAGIFAFFSDEIVDWVTAGVNWILDNIIPCVKEWALWIFDHAGQIWEWIKKISVWLFNFIADITSPDGWISKFINSVVDLFKKIAGYIKYIHKVTGKDAIDLLCLYLAGDTIGMLWVMLKTFAVWIWDWFKKTKFMRIVFGIINCLANIGEIIAGLWDALKEAISNAWGKLVAWMAGKGSFKDILSSFGEPFERWWNNVKRIFNDGYYDEVERGVRPQEQEDPNESLREAATKTKMNVRSLKVTGKRAEKVLAAIEEKAGVGAGTAMKKINRINEIFQENVDQALQYDEFIAEMWKLGSLSPNHAYNVINIIMESPELSQRLLSVFYLKDPFSGQIWRTVPTDRLSGFIENVRKIYEGNLPPDQKLREILMAFEQMNKERGDFLLNEQKQEIDNLVEDLKNAKPSEVEQFMGLLNTGKFKDVNDDWRNGGSEYSQRMLSTLLEYHTLRDSE